MIALSLVGALAFMFTAPQVASSWQAFATADLKEIRRLLEENHPGPVDPENRFYAERLNANYGPALGRAAAATSFFDYKRALLSYTNGFRDGHTVTLFIVDTTEFPWRRAFSWPRFAVRRDEQGAFRIREVEDVGGLQAGDELLSCEGASVDALMKERVDPFYWNADIPHERWRHLGRLLTMEVGDEAAALRSCRFRTASGDKEIKLEWRPISREKAEQLKARADFGNRPQLRRLGDIWHVVLPTFHYPEPEQQAEIEKLIAEIKRNAFAMRKGKVIFDVRGNGGGSSGWGNEIAIALWGDAWVSRVEGSFDWTADWRASPANLARLDETIARIEKSQRDAGYQRKVRGMVATALREGNPLVRVPSPPEPVKNTPPANPFTGQAYLLTDEVCASACLDFVDVVRRLPNVTHVGWPTSADTVYIENTIVPLPSGLAALSYSMKVNRNRMRGNNQWYEPEVKWPGGAVTDEALRRWVEGLE